MAVIEGYNIAFRILVDDEYITLAGRTQDDMTIAARTRESLTKNDAGNAQVAVIGHDVTFRATALIDLDGDEDITRDDLMDIVMQIGDDAEIEFSYASDTAGPSGQLVPASYYKCSGTCVITNYSETSNSPDAATLTVDFRVVGEMEYELVEPEIHVAPANP